MAGAKNLNQDNVVHWSRLFGMIKKSDGMAVYDICKELSTKEKLIYPEYPELIRNINVLLRNNKAKFTLGKSKDGMICRVLVEVKEHESARSRLNEEDTRKIEETIDIVSDTEYEE